MLATVTKADEDSEKTRRAVVVEVAATKELTERDKALIISCGDEQTAAAVKNAAAAESRVLKSGKLQPI